jgi:hypothetical protein
MSDKLQFVAGASVKSRDNLKIVGRFPNSPAVSLVTALIAWQYESCDKSQHSKLAC